MQNNEVLKVGQMVRIINGPMKDLKGRLHTICNKRLLIVYIESVGQYLPVTIARARVEPIIES
jgi:transcription antitermination factor NusG